MPGRTRVSFALLPLLMLLGCGSSEPQPEGPLTAAGAPFAYCLPSGTRGDITLGAEILAVEGRATVEVKEVQLLGAENVDVLEASVATLTTTNSFGISVGYPPSRELLGEFGLDKDWQRRQAIPGAMLADPPATQRHTLVLGLDLSAGGQFDGIELKYTNGNSEQSLKTGTSLRIAGPGKPCF